MWSASLLMGALAVLSLKDQFYRLTLEQGHIGAVDLRFRYGEVQAWFAGNANVYADLGGDYPPASYVLLWPLLGWLPLGVARWSWAVTSLAMLTWLILLIIVATGAQSNRERVFLAVLVLALNATGQAIGNGQLIVHALPMLLTSLILLQRPKRGWGTDCIAAALMIWALVQPTIAAPFFLIVMFASRSWRPAVLVVVGYAALTVFAAAFQFQGDAIAAVRSWIDSVPRSVTFLAPGGPYANVHTWLFQVGFESLMFPASLGILAILGVWIYRHRWADPWLLLGVTAIAARFWTLQRQYNDLVILIPMISLFMIARSSGSLPTWRVACGLLFSISVVVMLTPYRVYLFWPSPWPALYELSHALTWLTMLALLLWYAYRTPWPAMSTRETKP